jgi:uncharacterized membrane protein
MEDRVMLIGGILLWAVTHLFVAVGTDTREKLISRIGLQPYKGLFSLTLVAALVLIVMGWKAMPPSSLYAPPLWLHYITIVLMPIAIILFISARVPTDIKQFIRHPQLTGVKLWAFAHLLSNGETRAVILFGGMLAWAVAEVIVINRRDGVWQKPAPVGMAKTLMTMMIGLIATAVLVFAHPWFTGMPVIAGVQ